ncbi:MAG: hypothetical protein ACK501_22145 [Planctomycetota bacterium]|jgi:hypothetical protein
MRLLFASLLLLTSCGEAAFQPPAGHALVVVTNAAGTPIANASTWWLPAGAMANRQWLSGADSSWRDNSFEVLRRHGHARTSDANGLVAAPPGAWIAAEAGELAGVVRVPDPLPATASAVSLAIDDWHWVVRTVDNKGTPLAGVPIDASPSFASDEDNDDDEDKPPFLHAMLGQTDGAGRLVVRAPGGIDLEAEQRQRAHKKGERHVESPHAVVAARGLGIHEQERIRLTSRRSVEVTLNLSRVQRVDFTTPEDFWPRWFVAWTQRHRPGFGDEFAYAIEVEGKSVIYTVPSWEMTLTGSQWSWEQGAQDTSNQQDGFASLQVTLPMPPQVAVVRARLLATTAPLRNAATSGSREIRKSR